MKNTDLLKSDTLPKLLVKRARENGKKAAMFKKKLGIWQEYSWEDYLAEVKYFALGLKELGFTRGDKMAVIGENDPHWYWAELAALSIGGVVAGIFPDAIQSEMDFLATHSDAKFLVSSDQEQVDKALEIKDDLPLLEKVIFWEYKGLDNYNDPILMSWENVRALGKDYDQRYPDFFMQAVSEGKGADLALLLYTSGTSGQQKAAMRTHHNMIFSAFLWIDELGVTEEDRHFSFYSPAWIIEQHDGISVSLACGQKCYFPESSDTAFIDMREAGPTIFFTATRIWEGMASTIQLKIIDAAWLNRLVCRLFLPVGQKMADLVIKKQKPAIWLQALHYLAELLVFARMRDRMGLLKIREAMTAGALLSPEAFGYFWSLGIPIRQVYGLTEMAPITMHRRDNIDASTIGQTMPGTSVKINEEGEILIRGEGCFKGYYKNPAATKESIRDGWFHTGDWGNMNEKGHLMVFDRLKDAVRLKNGHKVAPQYIESRLKFNPYINDAIVIAGENYDYITVIINIELANVGKWADNNRISYLTFTDLSQKDEVYNLISEEIMRVNEDLPFETRIARFSNLYKQLDPDEAELTRTRKVKRAVFEDKYKDIISGLYGNVDSIQVETEVRYRDGKTGMLKTSVQIKDVPMSNDNA